VTEVDSLAGLYRVDRLLSGFPFQPAGTRVTPVSDTLRPRTLVERLALGLVRGTIAWPIAMDTLRAHYERAGEYEPAMRVARAMAQEYRYAAAPYMDAGRIALAQGRHGEALRWVREAHRRRETAGSARLLGLLSLRQGDHAAATTWLRRAVQLSPRDRQMQLVLSAAQAIPRLEQDRARRANDLELLLELAAVYAITEQYERSREVLEAIFRIDPDHAGGRALEAKLPPQPH
jgi:tetratricopeptide (TPR) repeat protein